MANPSADVLSPGDIGIIQYTLYRERSAAVGTEVVVIQYGFLEYTHLATGRLKENYGYYAERSDGARRFYHVDQLKRKPPPREELGDWELIPWVRPTTEKVHG